jgi:hypothetical protein
MEKWLATIPDGKLPTNQDCRLRKRRKKKTITNKY